MNLETYIADAFSEGLSYNEAVQLCLRLYCNVQGVPKQLQSQCSKDGLAEIFARLASRKFLTTEPLTAVLYGANFHGVEEKGHWTEIIASIFKKENTVDSELGEVIATRLTRRSKGRSASLRAP